MTKKKGNYLNLDYLQKKLRSKSLNKWKNQHSITNLSQKSNITIKEISSFQIPIRNQAQQKIIHNLKDFYKSTNRNFYFKNFKLNEAVNNAIRQKKADLTAKKSSNGKCYYKWINPLNEINYPKEESKPNESRKTNSEFIMKAKVSQVNLSLNSSSHNTSNSKIYGKEFEQEKQKRDSRLFNRLKLLSLNNPIDKDNFMKSSYLGSHISKEIIRIDDFQLLLLIT